MRRTLAMRSAMALLCALIAFTASQAQTKSADPQARDLATIRKFIAGEAVRLGGQEYRDARKIVDGDVNHDGRPDVAVLYTIEGMGGGNNYSQFLAVFLRDEKGQLAQAARVNVGGKLNREAHLESVADGVIAFSTLAYAEKDPACCPSVKGTARFRLVDGKLVEQK